MKCVGAAPATSSSASNLFGFPVHQLLTGGSKNRKPYGSVHFGGVTRDEAWRQIRFLFTFHAAIMLGNRMLPNKDRISRPSRGRYFPLSVPQVLTLLRESEFSPPQYQKRIDLIYKNPSSQNELGIPVAAFYPRDALVVYSFPESLSAVTAERLLRRAIRELRITEPGTPAIWSRTKATSYRAYFRDDNNLIFTQQMCTATLSKYRGGAKFSNAFKPKGIKSQEKFLHAIEVPFFI